MCVLLRLQHLTYPLLLLFPPSPSIPSHPTTHSGSPSLEQAEQQQYDLILSADVLQYLGQLEGVFQDAAALLDARRGLLAFTLEELQVRMYGRMCGRIHDVCRVVWCRAGWACALLLFVSRPCQPSHPH